MFHQNVPFRVMKLFNIFWHMEVQQTFLLFFFSWKTFYMTRFVGVCLSLAQQRHDHNSQGVAVCGVMLVVAAENCLTDMIVSSWFCGMVQCFVARHSLLHPLDPRQRYILKVIDVGFRALINKFASSLVIRTMRETFVSFSVKKVNWLFSASYDKWYQYG